MRNNAASDLSLKGAHPHPTLIPLPSPLHAVSCKFSVSNQRTLIEHESISKRSRARGLSLTPFFGREPSNEPQFHRACTYIALPTRRPSPVQPSSCVHGPTLFHPIFDTFLPSPPRPRFFCKFFD